MKIPRLLPPLCTALVFIAAAALAAAPLPSFTAKYRLLRNGAPIGEATLTLKRDAGDTWTFTTESNGTAGLAALLGASIHETSTFRWVGDLPQGESYDYAMRTAVKDRRRHMRFDWKSKTITVDDNGEHRYTSRPGALERHTVPLAIVAGLNAGKRDFALPVAVRDRVEIQHYAVKGNEPVSVPAGEFRAVRVSRIDGDADAFAAWFVPDKLPVPVKLMQRHHDELVLELQSWSVKP